MEAIETYTTPDGWRIEVHYDESSSSPREDRDGNIAHIVTFDGHGAEAIDERDAWTRTVIEDEGVAGLARYLLEGDDDDEPTAAFVWPLEAASFSGGVVMRLGERQQRHDFEPEPFRSGLVWVEPAEVRAWLGDDATPAAIERAVVAEVEQYRQWAAGEVYGFVVRTPSGEVVESVWGFYAEDAYAGSNAEPTGFKPQGHGVAGLAGMLAEAADVVAHHRARARSVLAFAASSAEVAGGLLRSAAEGTYADEPAGDAGASPKVRQARGLLATLDAAYSALRAASGDVAAIRAKVAGEVERAEAEKR